MKPITYKKLIPIWGINEQIFRFNFLKHFIHSMQQLLFTTKDAS